jgi:very-short-patch-repair endonuclease
MPHISHFDRCIECGDQIHYFQFVFSTNQFGISLCSACVRQHRMKTEKATLPEQKLFNELRKADIPATLQHFDGYKTVDIAIHDLQLHIEVDGKHHLQTDQALTDLKRSLYSLRDNVYTVRVPNRLVNDRIAETVKSIRNLYDTKKKKRGSGDGMKPGLLF